MQAEDLESVARQVLFPTLHLTNIYVPFQQEIALATTIAADRLTLPALPSRMSMAFLRMVTM